MTDVFGIDLGQFAPSLWYMFIYGLVIGFILSALRFVMFAIFERKE